jgi:hypothetical protein
MPLLDDVVDALTVDSAAPAPSAAGATVGAAVDGGTCCFARNFCRRM